MSDQKEFDELTSSIAKHNEAIATTIAEAQSSLVTAKEQLSRAESALDVLKKHIITVVENNHE